MKILLCSYQFSPKVGGIETVGEILAANFVRLGHEVKVVTESRGDRNHSEAGYLIVRSPGQRDLLSLYQWSDLVLQNQFSARLMWPRIRVRRPIFIIHHNFPSQDPNALRTFLKLQLCRVGTNLAISDALLRSLPFRCIRVHNPFRYDLFRSVARCYRDWNAGD